VIQGHTKEELLRQSYKVVAVLRQTRDSVVSGVVERVCFMMCRALSGRVNDQSQGDPGYDGYN